VAHIIIDNFNNGLDVRRSKEAAPPGSLRVLRNAFVNEGGEIEKRPAFKPLTTVTDAFGADAAGKIYGPVPGLVDRHVTVFQDPTVALPTDGFDQSGSSRAFVISRGDASSGGARDLKLFASHGISMSHDAVCVLSSSVFGSTFYTVPAGNLLGETTHIAGNFNRSAPITDITHGSPSGPSEVSENSGRGSQLVFGTKGYVVDQETFHISAVNDPSDMDGTGSGAVDISFQDGGAGRIIGLTPYYSQIAFFSENSVQFWSVASDPLANQFQRTIRANPVGPRCITPYGDGDVLYLGLTGVRQLSARDSSNFAAIDDVGAPIDELIQDEIRNITFTSEFKGNAFALMPTTVIDPITGQFWMCIGNKVYVLSRFRSSGVLAWSQYDLPSADPERAALINQSVASASQVADICRWEQSIILRNAANEFYLLGGESLSEYDQSEVEVITPYLDMGAPGKDKSVRGIEIAGSGTWRMEINTTPRDPNNWVPIGRVQFPHHTGARIPISATAQRIAFRLTCTSPEQAKIAQIIVFYEGGGEK
jgi:hypothetical protein